MQWATVTIEGRVRRLANLLGRRQAVICQLHMQRHLLGVSQRLSDDLIRQLNKLLRLELDQRVLCERLAAVVERAHTHRKRVCALYFEIVFHGLALFGRALIILGPCRRIRKAIAGAGDSCVHWLLT